MAQDRSESEWDDMFNELHFDIMWEQKFGGVHPVIKESDEPVFEQIEQVLLGPWFPLPSKKNRFAQWT